MRFGRLKHRTSNMVYGVVSKSGLMDHVRTHMAGIGAILLFHEVQRDPDMELGTGVTPQFLEGLIVWLRRNGWSIVSLEDGLIRILNGDRSRFVVITFDDGYRDNVTQALPVLEALKVPFLIYVPTEALTRELFSWWLGLRQVFRKKDSVEVERLGMRFNCSNLKSKIKALRQVSEWVAKDWSRKSSLKALFAAENVVLSDLNETYFLSERELEALSNHPLVTIGGHTTSHAALSTLCYDTARREMIDNKTYLERLLRRPIQHFAYPYGTQSACGQREATLAREAGFSTAVTTWHGQLWPRATNVHLLPRIGFHGGESQAGIDARVSGLQSLILKSINYIR